MIGADIIAVDECKSNNGACQMICVDKVVGHKCHCSFGYRLNEDARTCTGIVVWHRLEL